MSGFRVYLRVVSSALRPEEISARLRVEADEVRPIGSRDRPRSPRREHTSWIRRAGSNPDDLDEQLRGWGRAFAEGLGRLVENAEAGVYLVIVQEIDDPDDSLQKGIYLSPEVIAWLAVAGAAVDVDQYVYVETSVVGGEA